MRLLSNLHVKGKPTVLPDHAIRRQSHYFIYRPCMSSTSTPKCTQKPLLKMTVTTVLFCQHDVT